MSTLGLSACRPTIRFASRLRVGHAQAEYLLASPSLGFVRTVSSASGTTWEPLGISTNISRRLQEGYPHIDNPTPAQRALLLSLFRHSRRDVFLRDGMGRGKTFAMALAGLQLAQTEPVLVLAPSQQLVQQIDTHVHHLSAPGSDPRLMVTTPQTAIKDKDHLENQYGTVMMDEPETMLAPLPPRNLPAGAVKSHPFMRHPPPLASFLDDIRPRNTTGIGPRTIWVGAEINSLLKRVVRQRGWATMEALELDFGADPSARGMRDVEAILGADSAPARPRASVRHTGLLVDEATGAITVNQDPTSEAMPVPAYCTGRPVIHQSILDAIVAYEAQHSMMAGQAALVLPPEGYPLDLLAVQLSETSASATVGGGARLQCSIVGSDDTNQHKQSHMLIAPRFAVPGLDIPHLRRIYLINGLDLASLSPAQRARGGLKRRRAFYDVVTGRLGRLGSVTADGQAGEVISLVVRGSGEELGLLHRSS